VDISSPHVVQSFPEEPPISSRLSVDTATDAKSPGVTPGLPCVYTVEKSASAVTVASVLVGLADAAVFHGSVPLSGVAMIIF
jgi:hypothetical protein